MSQKAKNKFEKQFVAHKQKSFDSVASIGIALKQLEQQNNELAVIYSSVEQEIQRLKEIEVEIENQIAFNQNIINSLKQITEVAE